MPRPLVRRKKKRRVFVPVLVLMVMGGTLIALVSPTIHWHGGNEHMVAAAIMSNMGSAVEAYLLREERLPASLKDLTAVTPRNPHAYIGEIRPDPWGNAYRYRILGRSGYRITSAGEDETFDTDDDIVWPPDAW